ncbi:alpha/beta hydrolase [Streptomyces griseus]|uniref:alpha/beta hydrolase n=1 Tax=Streptomyces griseus TaxID=1911 RepID=UPI0020C7BF67|nr:alpha/beta hydrolase [Streptomyces griseus]
MQIDAEGPRNVLLLQNRRDASTPHRGGKMLREKFGDRARLVSVDDSGHGVCVLGRNSCASNLTTRYLVGGDAREGHVLPRGLTTSTPGLLIRDGWHPVAGGAGRAVIAGRPDRRGAPGDAASRRPGPDCRDR